jgi:hypothetical protein
LLELPFEQTPHAESPPQVVDRSGHNLVEQLAALVQVWPPKAQVPELFRGQSPFCVQACVVT